MLQRMLSAFTTILSISLICVIRAKDPPSYSMDFLPDTSFTCEGKSNGGFYADVETDCQLYHVCSRDKHGLMDDTMFLCGNGTVFDQRRLVCQDFRRVRCSNAPRYYRLPSHQPAEPKRQKIEDDVRIYEPPSYSMEYLPETSFTCQGKTNGGYYADIEAECQLYHVCSRNKDGVLDGTKFLCGNGTVFDQKKLVCENFRKVRCQDSPRYYRNTATLLEELEKRRRSEEDDRKIFKDADVDLRRIE